MSDGAERVRRLAQVAGVAARERRVFDWASIEDGLGMRLPADCKVLAESFPEGWFRLFAHIRLPERPEGGRQRLLSEYAVAELDWLRESRASGVSPFPYPVFPSRAGCCRGGRFAALGWRTG